MTVTRGWVNLISSSKNPNSGPAAAHVIMVPVRGSADLADMSQSALFSYQASSLPIAAVRSHFCPSVLEKYVFEPKYVANQGFEHFRKGLHACLRDFWQTMAACSGNEHKHCALTEFGRDRRLIGGAAIFRAQGTSQPSQQTAVSCERYWQQVYDEWRMNRFALCTQFNRTLPHRIWKNFQVSPSIMSKCGPLRFGKRVIAAQGLSVADTCSLAPWS